MHVYKFSVELRCGEVDDERGSCGEDGEGVGVIRRLYFAAQSMTQLLIPDWKCVCSASMPRETRRERASVAKRDMASETACGGGVECERAWRVRGPAPVSLIVGSL